MSLTRRLTFTLALLTLSSAGFAKDINHPEDLLRPSLFLGYEQGKLKDFGTLRGPNFNFHLETDYPVGLMGSLTAMKNDWDYHDRNSSTPKSGETKPPKRNAEYYSAMIGPTTRVNDVVSLYALAGISHTRVKLIENGTVDSTTSSNAFAWSAGVLANVTKNLLLKVGYEGSAAAFNGKKHPLNAFMIDVGYRF
ncbi:Ail/Lom family outer membrane beta-barrel protein [Candidatus Pantoea formicae]|uniref:Ail/Lom family outer membrane beta-barrel protein n=1 Tax=Candidatus Pantoea formicae TaxID=2608355 RepID=UPI003EDA1407